MARQLVRFTYPPSLVTEPIIYQIGREFGVATNIRRASVSKDGGWVILEIEGDDEHVERAVNWARGKGMLVERLQGDLSD